MINDWIQPCASLVRRRLMRISRISNRPPLARFCILADSPVTKPSINPFSTTEWRRGIPSSSLPMEFRRRFLLAASSFPVLVSFLRIFLSPIYFLSSFFSLPFLFCFIRKILDYSLNVTSDSLDRRSEFSQIMKETYRKKWSQPFLDIRFE